MHTIKQEKTTAEKNDRDENAALHPQRSTLIFTLCLLADQHPSSSCSMYGSNGFKEKRILTLNELTRIEIKTIGKTDTVAVSIQFVNKTLTTREASS